MHESSTATQRIARGTHAAKGGPPSFRRGTVQAGRALAGLKALELRSVGRHRGSTIGDLRAVLPTKQGTAVIAPVGSSERKKIDRKRSPETARDAATQFADAVVAARLTMATALVRKRVDAPPATSCQHRSHAEPHTWVQTHKQHKETVLGCLTTHDAGRGCGAA